MSWMTLSLAALSCFFFIGSSYGEVDDDHYNVNFALTYLTRFGYIAGSSSNLSQLISPEGVSNAIKDFQAFAQIPVTGQLDNETYSLMQLPRCGVKDKVGYGTTARRRKRYALQGSRWRTKDLTFDIVRYPGKRHGLSTSEVDSVIQKALNVWSDHTDLTFTRKKKEKVHIEISFVSGEHGDGDPFDGKGGTLAHAFFPVYGGDAHFDDQERWTINSRWGTDLFQVAAHEFGHSLGLSHSDIKSSLMAPFYRGYDPSFELHQDDIRGIQKLYGKKTKSGGRDKPTTKRPTVNTTPRSKEETDEVLCSSNNRIDAITTDSNKETFVFKGSKYWKLTDTGVAAGYPRLISRDWKGVPSNIDAVFQWKNGKMFFFKGENYYRVENKKVDEGYPKKISQGFAGIPDDVDTAFVWSGNGMIYFFKGRSYYRFDPASKPPVKSVYPKSVSVWEGLPNNIDAALQYKNDYTYFFKGDDYYRFNDQYFSVDEADTPYPRSAARWWFGCSSSQNIENDGDGAFNSIDNNNIDAEGDGVVGTKPSTPRPTTGGARKPTRVPDRTSSKRPAPTSTTTVPTSFSTTKRPNLFSVFNIAKPSTSSRRRFLINLWKRHKLYPFPQFRSASLFSDEDFDSDLHLPLRFPSPPDIQPQFIHRFPSSSLNARSDRRRRPFHERNRPRGSGCKGGDYVLNLPSRGDSSRLLPSVVMVLLFVFL